MKMKVPVMEKVMTLCSWHNKKEVIEVFSYFIFVFQYNANFLTHVLITSLHW